MSTRNKIDNFLAEYQQLCEKHKMMLSYEVFYNDRSSDWGIDLRGTKKQILKHIQDVSKDCFCIFPEEEEKNND